MPPIAGSVGHLSVWQSPDCVTCFGQRTSMSRARFESDMAVPAALSS